MSIFWAFFMAACGLLAGLAAGIVVFAFVLSVTYTACERAAKWLDAQIEKLSKASK